MPDERYDTCTYRVLRYAPNLLRDEWLNIGVLLLPPQGGRLAWRLLEDETDFARLRRLHPEADLDLLRSLAGDFDAQLRSNGADPAAFLAKLDDTLSNALQFSPQKAVLTRDTAAELDRLYEDQVRPPQPRRRGVEQPGTRAYIHTRARMAFQSAGILGKMTPSVRVEEFTERGDPFKLDFAYRSNGTRGFLHALALGRDPAQAKVLAYTAGRVRERLADAEFYALTEAEPRPEVERHQFIARLLAGQKVEMVPLARVGELAEKLRRTLN